MKIKFLFGAEDEGIPVVPHRKCGSEFHFTGEAGEFGEELTKVVVLNTLPSVLRGLAELVGDVFGRTAGETTSWLGRRLVNADLRQVAAYMLGEEEFADAVRTAEAAAAAERKVAAERPRNVDLERGIIGKPGQAPEQLHVVLSGPEYSGPGFVEQADGSKLLGVELVGVRYVRVRDEEVLGPIAERAVERVIKALDERDWFGGVNKAQLADFKTEARRHISVACAQAAAGYRGKP